jgi:hypothetical protein
MAQCRTAYLVSTLAALDGKADYFLRAETFLTWVAASRV